MHEICMKAFFDILNKYIDLINLSERCSERKMVNNIIEI